MNPILPSGRARSPRSPPRSPPCFATTAASGPGGRGLASAGGIALEGGGAARARRGTPWARAASRPTSAPSSTIAKDFLHAVPYIGVLGGERNARPSTAGSAVLAELTLPGVPLSIGAGLEVAGLLVLRPTAKRASATCSAAASASHSTP